ncbi:MAG: TetR/AcrR family transcriptional regulator [Lachnospiraceae bacterium]|nr:TetR/AcrR family transcriptional regulator [Lachnospiraceae bacterium]
MNREFISQKDKILISAIEIISDSGLSGLNLRNLAVRGNISEETVYKCFGGVDEILSEVVDSFVRYDGIIKDTINSKDCSYLEKIKYYFDVYATYYENYKEISAIVLHYEELLHNTNTRDRISDCVKNRYWFLVELINDAIESKELKGDTSAETLAEVLISVMNGMILGRRLVTREHTFKQELMKVVNELMSFYELRS